MYDLHTMLLWVCLVIFVGVFGVMFKNSADVADYLLNEAQVVVTDGEGFGADGFLRLSYATSMENLHKAVDRMKGLFNTETQKMVG